MEKKRIVSRIVAVALALMVGAVFSMAAPEEASAAVKKPAKVKSLKVVDKTSGTMKLEWKKQKKVSGAAVKYAVNYKTTTDKKWTVKKVKKNTVTLKSLHPGKTYKVKVRGYIQKNGKSYRGKFSKTITVKIPPSVVNINGNEVEITDGEPVSLPSPNGGKGYDVVDAQVTSDQHGTTIVGTTTEGLSYYCTIDGYGIRSLFVGEWSKYQGVSPGGRSLEIEGEDATVYWTCDGTEPKVGQEDLIGKCRYTRDTFKYYRKAIAWEGSGQSPDPLEDGYLETTLRGTAHPGEVDILLEGDQSLDDERIRWFKAYKDGKLVAEYFQHTHPEGYQYNPVGKGQIVIDAIEELNRFDEEYWGPEAF